MTVSISATSSQITESNLFTARDLAERALRKIGAFSINDGAANGVELREALIWLDMLASEVTGTNKSHWLIPATIEKTLGIDVVSGSLRDFLAGDYPANGIAYVVSAHLRDSSGLDSELKLLTRYEYEAISDKDVSGRPETLFIDRREDETYHVNPVPDTADFTLRLVVQTFSPNFANGDGRTQHLFLREWQRYIVLALSADIGDGPVRKVSSSDIVRWRKEAQDAYDKLDAFSNKEKASQLRRTRAWGI